jgi:hypothetical protein
MDEMATGCKPAVPTSLSTEKSKRLGLPVPAPVTLPEVALLESAVTTAWADDALSASRSAATPAACGDAIEVPLIVFIAKSEVCHADVMALPGAKMSKQLP